jgi:DNA-binding LytR/AlgR family response regulator
MEKLRSEVNLVAVKEIRVLICDDNRESLDVIRQKAAEIFAKLNIQGKFDLYSTCESVSEDSLNNCDIALLDVDFEGQTSNGIDLARKVRQVNKRAVILFITNFIEYAPEGYEVQAFRYILKRDLDTVLGRYLMEAMELLSDSWDCLRLDYRGELLELPFDSILYLEVLGHSVSIVTEGETYTLSASLSSFEQELENHGFLRVHKSYLVNMRHIKKFQCRELTLDNGTAIRVSEKSYAEQKRKYLLWKGWQ